MKHLLVEWRRKKRDYWLTALTLFGLWLLGMALKYVLLAQSEWKLGNTDISSFLLTGECFMLPAWIGIDLYISFDLAVGFGSSRKQFLFHSMCLFFLEAASILLGTRLLMEVEKGMGRILYHAEESGAASPYLSVPWLLIYGLLFTAIGMLADMLVHKYGAKGGAALFMLWFGACALLVSDNKTLVQFREVFFGAASLPMPAQMLGGLLLGLAGCGLVLLGFRREAVRG